MSQAEPVNDDLEALDELAAGIRAARSGERVVIRRLGIALVPADEAEWLDEHEDEWLAERSREADKDAGPSRPAADVFAELDALER